MELYKIYTSYMLWDSAVFLAGGYAYSIDGELMTAKDPNDNKAGQFNLRTKRGWLTGQVAKCELNCG